MASQNFTAKKRAFLRAFRESGSITHAALAAKVSRRQHYNWLKDEQYVKFFDDAKEEAADLLEEEARRRAVDGIQQPVYYKGEQIGTRLVYSDTLLIFLLKVRGQRNSETR